MYKLSYYKYPNFGKHIKRSYSSNSHKIPTELIDTEGKMSSETHSLQQTVNLTNK
jgi:hypothetical protein